jgi:uncharacterized FAD-dependent dehydrogenase
MPEVLDLLVSPEVGFDQEHLLNYLSEKTGVSQDNIAVKLLRRSIDARSRQVRVNLKVELALKGESLSNNVQFPEYQNVQDKEEVHIIGCGPAGMFAALKLIELGLKPVIIERGKNVRERRRDLADLNKDHIVNPESNYCFGEGGAGTYSDGKLYTRSNKRRTVNDVLNTFFAHGAKEEIMIDTHPHIGTNKLPGIITAMRETILSSGGEIHFNTRLDDFVMQGKKIKALKLSSGETVPVKNVILATGHSARDIFYLLEINNIAIQFKPFALGVRVEHPQSLIDSIQYHQDTRGEYLPPSSYSLVSQIGGRGAFSFCMCPGGIIAPCATAPGEVVTNGWSPSKRNNPFANSGIVTEIKIDDLKAYAQFNELAGLKFQSEVEQKACSVAGGTQSAPAQRLVDFIEGKNSTYLPESSYQPGIVNSNLKDVLPDFVYKTLQQAFKDFGQKMKGYLTNDAVVHGVESRTSSPVRIPRDELDLHHIEIDNLYPCGEGAGYAGGIVSAAMDGQKIAMKISEKVLSL